MISLDWMTNFQAATATEMYHTHQTFIPSVWTRAALKSWSTKPFGQEQDAMEQGHRHRAAFRRLFAVQHLSSHPDLQISQIIRTRSVKSIGPCSEEYTATCSDTQFSWMLCSYQNEKREL